MAALPPLRLSAFTLPVSVWLAPVNTAPLLPNVPALIVGAAIVPCDVIVLLVVRVVNAPVDAVPFPIGVFCIAAA